MPFTESCSVEKPFIGIAGVSAQQPAGSPAAQAAMLGSPPPAASGVDVQAWFPNNPRLQFPLGEPVCRRTRRSAAYS